MSDKVLLAIIAAVSSIATAFITATYTASKTADQTVQAATSQQNAVIRSNQYDTSRALDQINRSTAGPLAEGQKLCRVIGKGQPLGDGLIVPKDWAISTCRDYQKKTGATSFQLGCVFPDGTSLAHSEGEFPERQCGWR